MSRLDHYYSQLLRVFKKKGGTARRDIDVIIAEMDMVCVLGVLGSDPWGFNIYSKHNYAFFVLWSLTFLWKDKLFANTNTTLFTNMICYPQIQNSMICTNRCISVNVFNL